MQKSKIFQGRYLWIQGRLNKFKGHNPSKNLMKDDQNFKRRDVKKGGSNKTGESTMAQGPTRPPFLNT